MMIVGAGVGLGQPVLEGVDWVLPISQQLAHPNTRYGNLRKATCSGMTKQGGPRKSQGQKVKSNGYNGNADQNQEIDDDRLR